MKRRRALAIFTNLDWTSMTEQNVFVVLQSQLIKLVLISSVVTVSRLTVFICLFVFVLFCRQKILGAGFYYKRERMRPVATQAGRCASGLVLDPRQNYLRLVSNPTALVIRAWRRKL